MGNQIDLMEIDLILWGIDLIDPEGDAQIMANHFEIYFEDKSGKAPCLFSLSCHQIHIRNPNIMELILVPHI
jgi:hypothetical protein